jgi:hypothetical protein
VVWFGAALLAFSLISGKQIHYLIPVMPAVALWLARRFQERPIRRVSLIVLGSLSLFIGIALLLAPEWCQLSGSYPACEDTPRLGGLLPLVLGLVLLMRSWPTNVARLRLIAAFPLVLLLGVLTNFIGLSQRQDVRPIALEIRALQDQGVTVVNVDKYHNQYQFAGRLEHPLKVLRGDELRRWAPYHPAAVLIVYQDRNETSLVDVAKAVYPYRGEQALIVSVKDWLRYKRSNAGQ